MEHSPPFPSLLVITGPTAVGKSALAVRVAQALGGEIVTADSRQVYRYMDIGTDKPPLAARGGVPHHLLDLVDPDAPYSLATYLQQAGEVIAQIGARGGLPILAGGTPQYITALVEGWQVPEVAPNLELRARLEARAAADGPATLYNELDRVDPQAAARVGPHNTRRLVRALEVFYSTGGQGAPLPQRQPPPYRLGQLALTAERATLYRRTDARIAEQQAQGLVEETRGLLARGYGWELPSMSGIGYRQMGYYLRGEMPLPAAVQRLTYDTHRFVRHQYTWFRRDPAWVWLDTTEGLAVDRVIAAVAAWQAGGPLALE